MYPRSQQLKSKGSSPVAFPQQPYLCLCMRRLAKHPVVIQSKQELFLHYQIYFTFCPMMLWDLKKKETTFNETWELANFCLTSNKEKKKFYAIWNLPFHKSYGNTLKSFMCNLGITWLQYKSMYLCSLFLWDTQQTHKHTNPFEGEGTEFTHWNYNNALKRARLVLLTGTTTQNSLN